MSDLLSHLGKDTLPDALIRDFVDWCVWKLTCPSLVVILERTGLERDAASIDVTKDYQSLITACAAAAQNAHAARQRTGPLGLSTAEATAFLAQRLAKAATQDAVDAEEVAFFTMQVCGWRGFAEGNFEDYHRKANAELEARQAQEEKLYALWKAYGEAENQAKSD
jgi:hypothetical protein